MIPIESAYGFTAIAWGSAAVAAGFYAAGLHYRRRYRASNGVAGARAGPISGLLVVGGAVAIAASLFHLDYQLDGTTLETPYVSVSCQIGNHPYVLAIVDGRPGNPEPAEDEFQIAREDIFLTGLSKLGEFDRYLERMIGLVSVAVGIVVVVTVRFFLSAGNDSVYSVLPRAALALALAACSVVALIASHHVLFLIINSQIVLLGSGFAYCYGDFEPVYRDLFRMIALSGSVAVLGLLVLPEALRVTYQT